MKPLALRTSLTLVYTGLLALLVTGLALGYHGLLVRQLDAESTTALQDVSRRLPGYLRFLEGGPTLEYRRDDPEAVLFIDEATRYYQVYDASTGSLLVQSPALELLGLHFTAEEVAAFRQDLRVRDLQTDQGRVRVLSTLVTAPAGGEYLLQVAAPLARIDQAIAGFERLLIWWILAGLAIAAAAGYWMSGRALAPLSRLALATRDVSIHNLRQRLPVRGGRDELDEVAHAFNQALDRLEHAITEMRQFSAALAHELRTPLAVLRGETELALTQPMTPEALQQKLAIQLDELDKLSRLIAQILTLARAEAGEIPLTRNNVDLRAIGQSVVEQLEPVAAVRRTTLACDAPDATVIAGDPAWLERLLLILIDNAIKFTPEGGRVALRVARSAGGALLEVRDTGVGIAPDALPHIFEPFYRADPSRSRRTEGTGLGLALAKWIVAHHDGAIDVSSRPGEGSVFTVHLPLTPPRPPATWE